MHYKTKFWAVALAFLGTALSGAAAHATVLYSDGAPSGAYDSWTINFGFQVQNSFNLSATSTLTGVTFGNWLFPGDSASSVGWAIISTEGTQTLACPTCSGTASLTPDGSFTVTENPTGFIGVDQSFSLPNLALGSGTYWLELQNLVVNGSTTGDPGYWDMNGGPSMTWESADGDVSGGNCTFFLGHPAGACSDSFDLLGTTITSVPEPASLAIFAPALLGFAFFRRRKRT